jgi:hypothetical protein
MLVMYTTWNHDTCCTAINELQAVWHKYRAHAGHLHHGNTFVPASVETYGHLGRPIMKYLRTLSFLAVTRGSFLASAHRELSVALVQSQGYVYRSCALLLAKASGRPVLPGADTPHLD